MTARRFGRAIGLALVVLGLLAMGGAPSAADAATGGKAVLLASSVSGSPSVEQTQAEANGFVVDVVDDATWGAMTKDDFAAYQLAIVGDATCSGLPAVVSQNAQALADAVMDNGTANSKTGNRVLIGTDPVFHYSQGGNKMIASAMAFASAVDGATNLYLDFSCGDPDYDSDGVPDGQEQLLPLLSVDPSPTWTQNAGPPCGGDVSLIANNDQFSTLSSTDIRGWGCSTHETFPQYPTDWNPLAIATDTATAPTCGNDVDTGEARCGEAYLLIAGSGIVATAPDLALTPLTATNPVGTDHTVTATVTNADDNSPRPGVPVTFVVTGANAGATGTCAPASCETGDDGKVTFTYTGANAGDDTINASITIDGSTQTATAQKTWTGTTATEGPFGDPTCADGIDNDGDGLIDSDDPDCAPPPPAHMCFGKAATITGNGVVTGTPGDDVIVTDGGADTVRGLGGNDLICTGRGDDTVSGGAGNDKINAGDGNDTVGGNNGNDLVRGGSGDDRLGGGHGADRLFGGVGNDRLNGGDGAPDLCDGEGGTDSTGGGCETLVSVP